MYPLLIIWVRGRIIVYDCSVTFPYGWRTVRHYRHITGKGTSVSDKLASAQTQRPALLEGCRGNVQCTAIISSQTTMFIYQGGSIWWDGDGYVTALKLDGCSMKWQSFVLLIRDPPHIYHDGTGIIVLFTLWFLFPEQPLRVSHVYTDWLLVGEPFAWAPVETIGAKSCLPTPLPSAVHCPSPFLSASMPRR